MTINLEKHRKRNAHTDTIASVRYSPSGRFLATADKGGKIVLWQRGRLRAAKSVCSPYSPLTGVWFSEDEHRLLAGHENGHIIVYALPDMKNIGHVQLKTNRSASMNVLAGTTPVLDWVLLVISPANDPNFYAVLEFCDFFTIRREDLHVMNHTHLSRAPFYCAAGSLNGRFFFLGDEHGYIMRSHVPEMKLELFGEHCEQVSAFDRGGQPTTMRAMTGISGLALSSDQQTLVSTSRSGGAQIWEAQASIQESFPSRSIDPLVTIEPLQNGWMRGVCFLSSIGAIMLGTDDGQITIWEYKGENSTLWAQCSEGVRSIDASPDGTQVAIGCEDGCLFLVPWPHTHSVSSSNKPLEGWFHRLFGKRGNRSSL